MEKTMMILHWGFDITLGITLIWLAWRLLTTPDLFKAIILFIAFGLMMSITWVRLGAEDIALAEAAIGAGITGALFLTTCGEICGSQAGQSSEGFHQQHRFFSRSSFLIGLVLLFLFYLGSLLLLLPVPWQGLGSEVFANLHTSGSKSPVTAVLLNFRGYDTLLELSVMLLTLIGVWSMGFQNSQAGTYPSGVVLIALIRPLIPMMILVSGYLLWSGKNGVGGAFQAGAVLGAAGVLLVLSDKPWFKVPGLKRIRLFLALGVLVFLLSAIATLFAGGAFLEFPKAFSGELILLIESAATLSIGFTLTLLFYGVTPDRPEVSS